MSHVHLAGRLVCKDADEARRVVEFLPDHLSLTRMEPECIVFEVTPTDDPLIWDVREEFGSESAFAEHQARVAASPWGRATAGIERRYSVTGSAR